MSKILNTENGAIFSPCRDYRYSLWRRWDMNATPSYAMFIGLNPSTADETANDPTVTRCINYSKEWGFNSFVMTNIFALRATDPKVMIAHKSPVGNDNDKALQDIARNAGIIICAWGIHGAHMGRGSIVSSLLNQRELMCLGTTNKGYPKHPLYLKKDKKPEKYILTIASCNE